MITNFSYVPLFVTLSTMSFNKETILVKRSYFKFSPQSLQTLTCACNCSLCYVLKLRCYPPCVGHVTCYDEKNKYVAHACIVSLLWLHRMERTKLSISCADTNSPQCPSVRVTLCRLYTSSEQLTLHPICTYSLLLFTHTMLFFCRLHVLSSCFLFAAWDVVSAMFVVHFATDE